MFTLLAVCGINRDVFSGVKWRDRIGLVPLGQWWMQYFPFVYVKRSKEMGTYISSINTFIELVTHEWRSAWLCAKLTSIHWFQP